MGTYKRLYIKDEIIVMYNVFESINYENELLLSLKNQKIYIKYLISISVMNTLFSYSIIPEDNFCISRL